MKVSMSLLAVGAVGAGLRADPEVDFVIDDFLEPTFAELEPSTTTHTKDGLLVYRARPRHGARPRRHRDRLPRLGAEAGHRRARARAVPRRCTTLFVNKWYFDELIDALVVRPTLRVAYFARDVFEPRVVDETLVGGTTGIVRACSAAVRAIQSGFVRYYAALLVLGVAGVGFYFLLQS